MKTEQQIRRAANVLSEMSKAALKKGDALSCAMYYTLAASMLWCVEGQSDAIATIDEILSGGGQ